jgi:hypothetical protein
MIPDVIERYRYRQEKTMRNMIVVASLLALNACGKTIEKSVAEATMRQEHNWSMAKVVQNNRVLPWPWWDYICSSRYDVRFYVVGVNASGERDAATVCCRSGEPCAVH